MDPNRKDRISKDIYNLRILKMFGVIAALASFLTLITIIVVINRAADQSMRLAEAHNAQVCVLRVLFTEPEFRKTDWTIDRLKNECALTEVEAKSVLVK